MQCGNVAMCQYANVLIRDEGQGTSGPCRQGFVGRKLLAMTALTARLHDIKCGTQYYQSIPTGWQSSSFRKRLKLRVFA